MEKLLLTLYIFENRESNLDAIEQFQQSGKTVNWFFFIDILHIFARLGINTIKLIEGRGSIE